MTEQRHRAGLGRGVLQPEHHARPDRDVAQRGQVREQLEVLEHHPHAAADRAHVPPFGPDLRAVEHDAPGVRPLECVKAAQEGGFPGAGWADQADHLAARDAQGQAVEGGMRGRTT